MYFSNNGDKLTQKLKNISLIVANIPIHVNIKANWSRKVTRNLATQIGIYNGAKGIVVGFEFHTAIPEESFPTVNTFHTLKNRKLPIVFVKLDRYTGTQLSTDVDKIRLTVNGTHYMRWQLPLILACSITTHKSQSMTAHNGIVYDP